MKLQLAILKPAMILGNDVYVCLSGLINAMSVPINYSHICLLSGFSKQSWY